MSSQATFRTPSPPMAPPGTSEWRIGSERLKAGESEVLDHKELLQTIIKTSIVASWSAI